MSRIGASAGCLFLLRMLTRSLRKDQDTCEDKDCQDSGSGVATEVQGAMRYGLIEKVAVVVPTVVVATIVIQY